jgi:serine O-acetyltransferase
LRCGITPRERLHELIFNIGVWAVISYRFRRWVFDLRLPKWVKIPLTATSLAVQLATEIVTNIQIPGSVQIGPGLYIAHAGYIVVSSSATIGSNCTLTQGVTIGHGGGGDRAKRGSPIIGDRVYIGPGSAIIGPITIGNDALIGVGAIVTRSVPPRGVVVGNPGRVISYRGSFDLIACPGIEPDQASQRTDAM